MAPKGKGKGKGQRKEGEKSKKMCCVLPLATRRGCVAQRIFAVLHTNIQVRGQEWLARCLCCANCLGIDTSLLRHPLGRDSPCLVVYYDNRHLILSSNRWNVEAHLLLYRRWNRCCCSLRPLAPSWLLPAIVTYLRWSKLSRGHYVLGFHRYWTKHTKELFDAAVWFWEGRAAIKGGKPNENSKQ